MEAGSLILTTEIDDSGIDKGIKDIEKKEFKPKELEVDTEGAKSALTDVFNEFEQMKQEFKEGFNEGLQETQAIVEALQEMFPDLNIKELLQDTKEVNINLKQIGNSIIKTIKKVGRWALAIFGIRGAYMAVRNAINIISQGDEKLKADIEYMKNAIAYTLEPVVRKIVELIKQLMIYMGYIIYKWTGKNIFENANKSLQNANKQAKQLRKTMSGFDEMNILNSDGSVSSTAPSFNLASPEDVPIPSWIQWIADNGEIVGAVIAGITGALISMKILGLDPIMALGIGAVIAGIILLIKDVIDMIKDPSWQGFANILSDITIIIGGIMLVMNNWWGLLVIIVGAIVKLVANNWDAIMNVLKTVGGWIYDNIIKPVGDFFGGLWN